MISYRGEGESGRGVRRYERLIPSSSSSSSSFISSAAVPAYIVLRCSSLVAIFHGDCICDLCVNRNESAERFPLAFDSPPRSSCVCRYHTRSHACIDTNSKPAFKYYVHIGFFTSFFLHKCKSSTDHTHTHTCACSTGVGGAKVDNASSEVCRHPCEELLVLLTEIHGLRIVTSNLLEDLERVVRQARVFNSLMLLLF